MKTRYPTADGQQVHSTAELNDAYPFQRYDHTGDRAEDFMDFIDDPPTECDYCTKPTTGPYWLIEVLGTFMCDECMEKATGQCS